MQSVKQQIDWGFWATAGLVTLVFFFAFVIVGQSSAVDAQSGDDLSVQHLGSAP